MPQVRTAGQFTETRHGASWAPAMPKRSPPRPMSWPRLLNLVGGWLLVAVGIVLIPLPGPGWLVVGIGLLVLGREVRWARGALVRLERFMRRHGMRTSLRRLIARRRRERARQEPPHPTGAAP